MFRNQFYPAHYDQEQNNPREGVTRKAYSDPQEFCDLYQTQFTENKNSPNTNTTLKPKHSMLQHWTPRETATKIIKAAMECVPGAMGGQLNTLIDIGSGGNCLSLAVLKANPHFLSVVSIDHDAEALQYGNNLLRNMCGAKLYPCLAEIDDSTAILSKASVIISNPAFEKRSPEILANLLRYAASTYR